MVVPFTAALSRLLGAPLHPCMSMQGGHTGSVLSLPSHIRSCGHSGAAEGLSAALVRT